MKYDETVCTAGLRDGQRWIRIYPVAFRSLDKSKKFKKYQWIEADIVRDSRDPRRESYKLAGEIKTLNFVDTRLNWDERKKFVLGKVYYNLDTLIQETRDIKNSTSLATFKPARIINFKIREKTKAEKIGNRSDTVSARCKNEINKIPYNFFYTVIDQLGRRSTMQIHDWEIYQLCRKIIFQHGHNKELIEKILNEKYFLRFVKNCDIHLFLGTSRQWHIRRNRNPFMIIGIFYPPISRRKM